MEMLADQKLRKWKGGSNREVEERGEDYFSLYFSSVLAYSAVNVDENLSSRVIVVSLLTDVFSDGAHQENPNTK